MCSIKENLEGNIEEEVITKYQEKFKIALENDLNTANAVTTLYDVLKENCTNATKLALIESFDKVLSLNLLKEEEVDTELDTYINEMIDKRNEAKKNKNYALADSIRNELLEKGIELKDTREGTIYQIKK